MSTLRQCVGIAYQAPIVAGQHAGGLTAALDAIPLARKLMQLWRPTTHFAPVMRTEA